MTQQIPGKIFLADQRGLVETSTFRRYSTFSFGTYAHVHKAPFGRLYAVNEETLGGGQHNQFAVPAASHLLILPITGTVQVVDASGHRHAVDAGERLLLSVPAQGVIQFANPYAADLISFLHLWVRAEPATEAAAQWAAFDFPASSAAPFAELVGPQLPGDYARPLPFTCSLGRFAGRQEAVYTVGPSGAQCFAFVLAGAFEVEGRLLHEKDGLALWDAAAFEIEALSNNALILVLKLAA